MGSERSLNFTALCCFISRLPMRCISTQVPKIPFSPAPRVPCSWAWKGSWSSISCFWGVAFRHCDQISALIPHIVGAGRWGTPGAVTWSVLPKRQEGTRTWPTTAFLPQATRGVLWGVVPAHRTGCFGCAIESSSISQRDCPLKSKWLHLLC